MSTETKKIEETPQVETVPADKVGTPGTVLMVAFSVLGPFSMHLIIPAIKPIQLDYGVGGGTASLLISATLWGIAAATLFYGILADRFGRRPMLLWGLVLFAAGSVLGMVGWSADAVIAGRVIQGIGGACGMVISRTVIRDRYPRDQGTSILAYLTMAVMIAPILAPAFAGFLVENYGWRMVFVIASVTGFAVLIWTAMRFPETT
ncbi:MAG: MFS transporter, partial [Alphaproteobacteria bacterium]|nr:MFS transporter [Alphaproteobacteria bacterium]